MMVSLASRQGEGEGGDFRRRAVSPPASAREERRGSFNHDEQLLTLLRDGEDHTNAQIIGWWRDGKEWFFLKILDRAPHT